MLSKLGTACWSCLTVKLEAVQGAVCMTCYHGVAVSPGCHACDIAVVGMIIQGQGLVGLEHPTLHLQAAVCRWTCRLFAGVYGTHGIL